MTAAGHVAIVDDEESIRQTVGLALRREGYEVTTWDDGQAAWEAFRERMPDLVVLDILMPRMDGLELCRRLRGLSEAVPILFLSSKDEEFDRVLGLELGGDDYLCKPFSMRELVARVRVLFRRRALRRDPTTATQVLVAGDLMLDLDRFQAAWKGAPLALTVTEFRILHALARHSGRVKTRQQLVEEGYPEDTYVSDRTVDTHIKRLRKKLAAVDPEADPVETMYGLGYRWR
jgi:DNA-binding response OmpR family regulator